MLEFEWDEAKRVSNRAAHSVDFELIADVDWETARYIPDNRQDYGEGRILAYAVIGDRLHAIVFTIRKTGIRIISMRRANNREIDRYVAQIESS
ncbi:MAG: BrnT family toxin [Pseudomonadota bacterium]